MPGKAHLFGLWCITLVACDASKAGGSPEAQETAAPEDSAVPQDSGEEEDTAPPPPVDADGDGAVEGEDCDDADAAAYPGAKEQWNGRDDNCDGRVDADGSFAGEVTVEAVGVYMGVGYPFRLSCPGTLLRAEPELEAEVRCTPDPEDEMAMLLLGEELTIALSSGAASGASWDGAAEILSSEGWDTRAEAEVAWSDFDRCALQVRLDAVSLDLYASGELLTR